MTPTARTLVELRAHGWLPAVVESWIPHANIRQDLYGCIDVLACKPGEPILAIQATSGSNHAARVAKAKAEPRLIVWLQAGGTFAVWSWDKVEGRWMVRKTPHRAGGTQRHLDGHCTTPAEAKAEGAEFVRSSNASPLQRWRTIGRWDKAEPIRTSKRATIAVRPKAADSAS
jgi:hypothetical protein